MRRRDGRLVDQVDRLVGQEAVGDVAVRQRRSRDDRAVHDAHAVVHLVLLLEAAQDRDRVFGTRLAHEHRLEPSLECCVLLDVLAILVERRRTDRVQLTACERRLEHVARVHRAFGGTCAHQRVQLVDEQHQPSLGLLDLAQNRLEPVLELAAVLRARHHRAQIERDHVFVAQTRRHVAIDDALSESLDDRGLARARLADEHRVVLRAARQHLDHSPDLVVAADDRIELAVASGLREIAAEPLERLELRLGILVGHASAAAQLLERLEHALRAHTGSLQQPSGLTRILGEPDEQMLRRDVRVFELLGMLERGVEHAIEPRTDTRWPRDATPAHLGHAFDRRGELGREHVGIAADLLHDGTHDSFSGIEQHLEQVLGFDGLRRSIVGNALRGLQRLLGLDCELVQTHGDQPFVRGPRKGPLLSRDADRRHRPTVQAGAVLFLNRRDHTQATACQPGPP